MRASALFIIAVLALQCSLFVSAQQLGTYNVDLNQTTVSGISAGAYMAAQFHVAFSSTVKGAGIVAGGPFACAKGSMTTALTACMTTPTSINLNQLYTKAEGLGSQIDPLSNLQGQKVYIYDGTKDSVVKPGCGKKGADWYTHYGANLKTVYDVPSQHAWITNNYGSACAKLSSPYINNCQYNQAQDLLQWFYGTLNPGVAQISSNLLSFDQSAFTSSGDSMGNTGYVYVPSSCKANATCRVHVAFHGCKMTIADIGTDYVVNSGLNEIAEANNIIVLYPQCKKSLLSPSNPNGCFDWWGYTVNTLPVQTSLKYVTKQGPQMQAIYAEISKLAGKPFTFDRTETLFEGDEHTTETVSI